MRLTPGVIADIQRSREQGETYTALAERYRVSAATVWRVLHPAYPACGRYLGLPLDRLDAERRGVRARLRRDLTNLRRVRRRLARGHWCGWEERSRWDAVLAYAKAGRNYREIGQLAGCSLAFVARLLTGDLVRLARYQLLEINAYLLARVRDGRRRLLQIENAEALYHRRAAGYGPPPPDSWLNIEGDNDGPID